MVMQQSAYGFAEAQSAVGDYLDHYGALLSYARHMGEVVTSTFAAPVGTYEPPALSQRQRQAAYAVQCIEQLTRTLCRLESLEAPLRATGEGAISHHDLLEYAGMLFYGPQIVAQAGALATSFATMHTPDRDALDAVHADLTGAGFPPPGGLGPDMDKARDYLAHHLHQAMTEAETGLAAIVERHAASLVPGYGALARTFPPRLEPPSRGRAPLN